MKICPMCGNSFSKRDNESVTTYIKKTFCSASCMRKLYRTGYKKEKKPLTERYFEVDEQLEHEWQEEKIDS